jgi:hypothetical protein
VFNDTKGGFRTDILTFHTPLLSDTYFKFPIEAGRENLDNNAILPFTLDGSGNPTTTPIWLPRTREVIMYDRPGDPVGGFIAGSKLYNQNDLVFEREKHGVHEVYPGVSGWAQVNGRDTLPIRQKAALDGEYIKHFSFFTDFKLLIKTVLAILKSDGVVEGGTGALESKHGDSSS